MLRRLPEDSWLLQTYKCSTNVNRLLHCNTIVASSQNIRYTTMPHSFPKYPRKRIISTEPWAVNTADICHPSIGARIPEIPFFCGAIMPDFLQARAFLANHDTSTILMPTAHSSQQNLPRNHRYIALSATQRGIDSLILTLATLRHPAETYASALRHLI